MSITRILFAFLLLLGVAFTAQADTYKYAIIAKGDTAGYLIIEQTMVNDTFMYSFKSEASVTFIKRFDVVHSKQCKYYDDMLVFAESSNVVNGEMKEYARCQWNEGSYAVQRDNDHFTLDEPVNFSTMRLFFKEPVGISSFYSEAKARYYDLDKIGAHSYRIPTGFGKHDTYHYSNGKVVKADIVTPLIDFQMVLIDYIPTKIAMN